jgi:hypothetical protein
MSVTVAPSPAARRPGRRGIARAVPPPLRRPEVLGPALVTVAAGAALAFASSRALARMAPTEDGFYSLGIARQIALGHGITFDGGMPTDGFQPLWVLLCVPLYALAGGDRVLGLRLAEILGTVLWIAFAAAMAVGARDVARRHGLRGDVAAALAAVVVLGSLSVFRLFHNGLESGLLLLLVAVAVIAIDRMRTWTAASTVAVGALLGAIVWARLDAAAFVAALGAVAAWRALRRREAWSGPLLACTIGLVLLLPWLAWSLSVDGHLVPTSGRASFGRVDAGINAHAALRSVGAWLAAPVLRPSMHAHGLAAADVAAAAAITLFVLAVVAVRRRARPRPGMGTVALWGYAGLAAGYYVFAQGSFWFLDRYLAVVLVAALPWLATAGEAAVGALRRPRLLVGGVAVATALCNLPLFVVMLAAPVRPPAWAAPNSNTGTHPDVNYVPQTAWTLAHVSPSCRVGATESGTLGYFRDDVVNLDGKVNADVLRAIERRRRAAYVRARHIDVLVDVPVGVRAAAGERRAWRAVADLGRFKVWVRRGREGCIRGVRA